MSVVKLGEQEAVVCVRRSSWESVTEREEFVGRLREASRLPQYLGDHLSVGLCALALGLELHNCYVEA